MTLATYATRYLNDKYRPYGHNYVPGYETLFNNIRNDIRTVIEIGIGGADHQRSMRAKFPTYNTGNSLRMWRDYFENATIHGIDIDPAAMITDESRIFTHIGNQSSVSDLERIIQTIGSTPDIIIDDGVHFLEPQVISFMTLEKHLKKGGIYVIEDILAPNIEGFHNLTVFPVDFRRYILENYEIKWFDTRKDTGLSNDILMAFIRR
jgi:hypothetical protein